MKAVGPSVNNLMVSFAIDFSFLKTSLDSIEVYLILSSCCQSSCTFPNRKSEQYNLTTQVRWCISIISARLPKLSLL